MINTGSKRILTLTNQIIYASSFVEYSEKNKFGKIILNKPKALNSLNLEMVQKVSSLLPQISQTKAFWIEGAGGKAFCAGGDVKTLFEGNSSYDARVNFFEN